MPPQTCGAPLSHDVPSLGCGGCCVQWAAWLPTTRCVNFLFVQHQGREPNFHKWVRPAYEQGALPTLVKLPTVILHGFGASTQQRMPGRLCASAPSTSSEALKLFLFSMSMKPRTSRPRDHILSFRMPHGSEP